MRKTASLILVLSGILELITSIVLYIIPSGRVAYWSNYHLLGLSKTEWGDIHITVGVLFLTAAVIHIYFNWKPILSYLKNKSRQMVFFNRQFNIALIITIYVAVGTLFNLPPMNYVISIGEYFTESGNKKYGEPPYGHAELSSLKMFCSKMNLDLEKTLLLLRKAGMTVNSESQPVGEIAKVNNTTPQNIFLLIKPASTEPGSGNSDFPDAPPPGFGNKTIEALCSTYSLPLETVLKRFDNTGFSVKKEQSVKEVAGSNNSSPMAVFEVIKQVADNKK